MDPHRIAQHRMADLLADGLSDDDRTHLEEHLAGCSPCRVAFDDLTALTHLVAAVARESEATSRPISDREDASKDQSPGVDGPTGQRLLRGAGLVSAVAALLVAVAVVGAIVVARLVNGS